MIWLLFQPAIDLNTKEHKVQHKGTQRKIKFLCDPCLAGRQAS